MTIKLKDLINSQEALMELAKIKMPIKTSFSISRLIKQIQPEIEIYHEKRNLLLKEFGTLQPDGNSFLISKENIPKFNEGVNKMEEIDVSFDFIKIKIDELGDIQIEPRLLIDWIFE